MLRAVVKEEYAKTDEAQAIVENYYSEELKTRVENINEETAQSYWIIPE